MGREHALLIAGLIAAGVTIVVFFTFPGILAAPGTVPVNPPTIPTHTITPELPPVPAATPAIVPRETGTLATLAPSAPSPPSKTPPKTTDTTKIPVRTLATGTVPPFPAPPAPAPGDPYSISPTDIAGLVHTLVNKERSVQGLTVLSADPLLAGIAEKHSADMATNNFFDHVNPVGQDPTGRGAAAGYTCRKEYGTYYTYGLGENLFQNNRYSSVTYYSDGRYEYDWNSPEKIAESTVAGWMNSTGHRKNILAPTYDREGIGVTVASNDKVYITEDFC
jgi:uncharacterized protein YkwD